MALPSSPPLSMEQYVPPMEQNIPSSPPPLPLPASFSRAGSRKRQFSDYGSQSSDPVFSDATTDSEQHPAARDPERKKRFVRGHWWSLPQRGSQRPPSALKRQNPLRNADSGVWMGSDEDLGTSDFSSGLPAHVPDTGRSGSSQFGVTGLIDVQEPEALAAAAIRQCVDEGKESVNVSNMHLSTLSAATLAPLHQLIRSSHGDSTQVPSEDEFVPLIPSIQLFLYSNRLTGIPPEVFNLKNITVLSLRNNELEHIPSAIGRLSRLKELNISGNRIQHLPFEVVHLLSPAVNRQITLRPNPLLSVLDFDQHPLPLLDISRILREGPQMASAGPHDLHQLLREEYSRQTTLDLWAELEIRRILGSTCRRQDASVSHIGGRNYELVYLASSAVRYLNVTGTPPISARALKDPNAPDWSAQLEHPFPMDSSASAAPSLFELALRSLQRGDIHEALFEMTDQGTPDHVLVPLKQAVENKDRQYDSTCSTCQRSYIIPRAQWMEYWFYGTGSQLTNESVFPFLRQACSWACAKPSGIGEFRV